MIEAKAPSEHPCMGCGLCCNGVLYGRARAEIHEHEVLVAHGLELEEHDDKSYFVLPCKYESCGRCTIYESRFTVCRAFSCALLRRVDAGELSAASACKTVALAKALVEKVRTLDPEAGLYVERVRIRQALAEEVKAQVGDGRRRSGKRLLAMAALDLFLERWFRNKKGGEATS